MQDGSLPYPIAITVHDDGRAAVVEVSGELDLATAPELRAELHRWIREGRSTTVDLAGVTFMDATGLSVLIAAHKAALGRGDRLTVTGAGHRPVSRLFAITGADRTFDTRD